jgi:hypothetical protein
MTKPDNQSKAERERREAEMKARRGYVRREVVPLEVKGLLDGEGGVHQPFLIWDLSEEGVGIWVPEKLAVGLSIRMNVAVPRRCQLRATVSWCDENRESMGGWRCGVKVTEGLDHVRALMNDVSRARALTASGPVSRNE